MPNERQLGRDLTPLMRPRTIAVVGASQRPVRANRVIRTLRSVGFGGEIWPINPNYAEVMDLRCYPDLGSTPSPADCAVVAIPAGRVYDVLEAAAGAGVRSSIVLAAGFGESGEEGRVLQARLEALASDTGLLVCGPNCFGILNVHDRIAPFIGVIPIPLVAGNVALVSQSGGLTNVLAPPLMARGVGFSYVVSCGNQAGATIEEYLAFLVEDPATGVIGAFVEGFREPARLVGIGRRARELGKPIVILKVGRSEVARTAAMAHTASVVGSAEVAEAALRKAGLIQVRSLNDLLETLALLSVAGRPRERRWGTRLGVLTGTGGLMAYLGDAATDVGVELPRLAPATEDRLRAVMPDFVGVTNPLDGTGAMYEDAALFPALLGGLADDPGIDVVGAHIDFNPRNEDGLDRQRQWFVPDIVRLAPTLRKPVVVFTAHAGSLIDVETSTALRDAGVALLDGTEPALAAIRAMATLTGDTPGPGQHARAPDRGGAAVSTAIRSSARPGTTSAELDLSALPAGWLDQGAAFRLLGAAQVPVAERVPARTAAAAVEAAERLGYPVAMKIDSADIQHKTEVGGVALDLAGPEDLLRAFNAMLASVAERAPEAAITGVAIERMAVPGTEVLLGAKRDPDFGPVVAVGLGGLFVEVFEDVAVELPPISDAEARAMLRRLRSWPLLNGARGRPMADVDALVAAIRRLGDLAIQLGDRLEAIDINPLLVYPAGQGVLGVDALVRLRAP
jgi:acetyltransferase